MDRDRDRMTEKSIPRRTQAERTDEARTALVDAAIELIAERGLAGVTLSDVGARAGYSRGLAVYHFGSKAGLIVTVFDHLRDIGMRAIQRFGDSPKAGEDAVIAILEAISTAARSSPALYRATTAMLIDGSMATDEAVRQHTRTADEMTEKIFLDAVEGLATTHPQIDRTALARALINAVYGVQMRAFLHGERIDLKAEFDAIIAMVRQLTARPA
jgi:AcrR family transcriptional regulator